MTHELELGGEGARLHITVTGHENPGALGSDGEWLICSAGLTIHGFGAVASSFAMTVSDLQRLATVCSEVLARGSGLCSFDIEEQNLALQLELETRGQVKVRCILREVAMAKTQLEVEYTSDRATLSQFVHATSGAANTFASKP